MDKPVYEIIPSPLYGWNFKNSDSRHVIKYSSRKPELINYAVAYCKTHESKLIVYNFLNEMEEILNFNLNSQLADSRSNSFVNLTSINRGRKNRFFF
jgi:hypothetical protein